jgi:hypothetical protein
MGTDSRCKVLIRSITNFDFWRSASNDVECKGVLLMFYWHIILYFSKHLHIDTTFNVKMVNFIV